MSIKSLTIFSVVAFGLGVTGLGVTGLGMLPGGVSSATAAEDRYIVTPVEGGIMRVDRRTGEVSVCQRHKARWACELVEDNRRADRRGGFGSSRHERSDLTQGHNRRSRQEARRQAQEPYDDMEEPGFMSPEEVDNAMNSFERMVDRFLGTAKMIKKRMSEGETLE